jgi:hypothetical protein
MDDDDGRLEVTAGAEDEGGSWVAVGCAEPSSPKNFNISARSAIDACPIPFPKKPCNFEPSPYTACVNWEDGTPATFLLNDTPSTFDHWVSACLAHSGTTNVSSSPCQINILGLCPV